jgi:hypothetical protein
MPKVTFAQLAQSPPQAKQQILEVEEWGGGTFRLLQLSGLQYETVIERLKKEFGDEWQQKPGARMMAIVLAACLVDEDGQAPSEQFLLEQPVTLLNRLSKDAMVLNGMSSEARAELEKN